jgi:hypothetical protein
VANEAYWIQSDRLIVQKCQYIQRPINERHGAPCSLGYRNIISNRPDAQIWPIDFDQGVPRKGLIKPPSLYRVSAQPVDKNHVTGRLDVASKD